MSHTQKSCWFAQLDERSGVIARNTSGIIALSLLHSQFVFLSVYQFVYILPRVIIFHLSGPHLHPSVGATSVGVPGGGTHH